MLVDIPGRAEMSQIEDIRVKPFHQIDTRRPRFQVEVWWGSWRSHVIYPRQTHAGHIAREQLARMDIEENDMVDGVTRRIVDFQFATSHVENVSALDHVQSFRGGGLNLAPQ